MEACWITPQQETEGCEVTWDERVAVRASGKKLIASANKAAAAGVAISVDDDGFWFTVPAGSQVRYTKVQAIALRDALNELLPPEEPR